MNPSDVAWLAGLLEGEGSFRPRDSRINVEMCDADVIRRVSALTGGSVCAYPARNDNCRPTWVTACYGRNAARVAELVYPSMGFRRRTKMRECWPSLCADRVSGCLHWLAGFMEGEGCFTFARPDNDRCRTRLRLSFETTDRDVAEEAARLLGSSVYTRPVRHTCHKISFHSALSGQRAEDACLRLLPLMGQRRQLRIEELLSLDLSHRAKLLA